MKASSLPTVFSFSLVMVFDEFCFGEDFSEVSLTAPPGRVDEFSPTSMGVGHGKLLGSACFVFVVVFPVPGGGDDVK